MLQVNVNKPFFSLFFISIATDVNVAASPYGETPLHFAVNDWTNNLVSNYSLFTNDVNELVITLLKRGANPAKKGIKIKLLCVNFSKTRLEQVL